MDNIKDVLNNVIHKLSIKQPEKQNKIDRIWQTIATQKEKYHTCIDSFSDGILTILVDTPAWMYHLKMERLNILKRIQEEVSDVKDLKFKIGKVR